MNPTPEHKEQAREIVMQWREASDWPGLVWSAQNLSDEPRWLAAWVELETRIAAALSAKDAEIERHRRKWEDYERNYVVPCFAWAAEAGIDLQGLVKTNPGHNCVELLVRELQSRDTARADAIRECVVALHQIEAPDYNHGVQANGFEDGKVAAIDTIESLLTKEKKDAGNISTASEN